MPVSTRSKGKAAGKRGAKTTRNSASEKKAKRLEDGYTAAERCAKRLARQSRARRDARDNRDLTLGEQVLRNPLIRDLSIQDLNPYKLSDLQHVLNLRGFYKLLPDVDLKECFFEGAWGFQKDDFVLANWREMSVEVMKRKVSDAHPMLDDRRVYPPHKVDVDTLNTKEEIVRAFWELTYVPKGVYETAVGGAHVLRSVKAGDVGDPKVVSLYLWWACRAGLDLPVIRGLAEKCRERDIDVAAERAAETLLWTEQSCGACRSAPPSSAGTAPRTGSQRRRTRTRTRTRRTGPRATIGTLTTAMTTTAMTRTCN